MGKSTNNLIPNTIPSSTQNQNHNQNHINISNNESLSTEASASNTPLTDLSTIENEEIESLSGNKYIPSVFNKCIHPNGQLAMKMLSISKKIFLYKLKMGHKNIKSSYFPEIYIINREWFKKWAAYSRYNTIKRIIKTPDIYLSKPIEYIPKEENSPGIINNEILLIKNKTNDDTRNILVSQKNYALDTKLDYKKNIKLLCKTKFDLLNNYFKCDHPLKFPKMQIDSSSWEYNCFSVHVRAIFLPTFLTFKNAENLDEFRKKQKIIYDLYFHKYDTRSEIIEELLNIFKEKPFLLENMGIEISPELKDEEISNHISNLSFYIPNLKYNKYLSAEELSEIIFNNEAIEKFKKGEQLTNEEINLSKVGFNFTLSSLFHIDNSKKNVQYDDLPGATFLIEYYNEYSENSQNLISIFNFKNLNTINYYNNFIINGGDYENSVQRNNKNETYDLEKFELNEDNEKNKHGIVGLNNLGNTCYMNTGLQCLSNCELLSKYFLKNYYKKFINKDNPIGSNGIIVESFSQLIHHLWYGNENFIAPYQFKEKFSKYNNTFEGYRQHDSQEFLSYLLDVLHEDLNKVIKKPYIDSKELPCNLSEEEKFKIKKEIFLARNQSLIEDLFFGFYKSTIFCPNENCKYISENFESFNMITLSLINESELKKLEQIENEQNEKKGIKKLSVTFIPFKITNRPIKFEIKINKEIDIFNFKQKIEFMTGFNKNSFEIYKSQGPEFVTIKPDIINLNDFLKGENKIYLFQIPPYVFGKPIEYFDLVYENVVNNPDSIYLKEEKYEGTDLYPIYEKSDDDNAAPTTLNNNEIEIKQEDSLSIDKNVWVKAELYNYSYSGKEEYKISHSRIIYINKDWDNSEIYQCIFELLEGSRPDFDQIKEEWLKNIDKITKDLGKNKKDLLGSFDKINHPLLIKYLRSYNFNNTNIISKKDDWKELVFPYDIKKHTINSIIEGVLKKGNDLSDTELLFKLVWKPDFVEEYVNGTEPSQISPSEKLIKIINEENQNKLINKQEKNDEGKNKKKELDLCELLKNFGLNEQLTEDNKWYCPKCKNFQLANKKMEIYSLSKILIIHLKRFRNNRKIESLVNFPIENLDMGQYMSNNKEGENIYDLFAVANHRGGLHGGHYFAYCKNYLDNNWYEFNDSNVSKIEKKDIVTKGAYVLFYSKREKNQINEEELFLKPLIEIDYSKYV